MKGKPILFKTDESHSKGQMFVMGLGLFALILNIIGLTSFALVLLVIGLMIALIGLRDALVEMWSVK